MASIDDCFNQLTDANGHLVAIDGDLQTVNTSVQAVNTSVQAVDADINGITTAIQTGFSQLYTIANYTDQLLVYQIAAERHHRLLPRKDHPADLCALERGGAADCGATGDASGPGRSQAALRAGKPGRRGRAGSPRGSEGTGREVLPTTGAHAAVQVRAL